jgi:hypothetical protein
LPLRRCRRHLRGTPGYKNKDGTLGSWYCHHDHEGGDCIKLYAHITSVDNYDAATALQQHFIGKSVDAPTHSQPLPEKGMKRLDYLSTEHEAVELFGLPPEVCKALGIGYAAKGTMNRRIAVPLIDKRGELVGYFGIATKPDQVPLLKLPDSLAEKIGVSSIVEEPAVKSPDELRKLLRVV